MGFQTVSILNEGIWASITGGWYYDEKQSHFSNLFHLYIWLIFLCLPFVNYLYINTYLSWLLYCIVIGFIFLIIKLVNSYFHRVFDTGKCIKDELSSTELDPALNSPVGNEEQADNKEAFEMVVISQSQKSNDENIKCNGEASNKSVENHSIHGSNNDDKEPVSKTIDLKADVHCNNTDSSCANISLLFKTDEEDQYIVNSPGERNDGNELVKCVSNKSSLDIVSNSNTSLSNIGSIYTKANSTNNSIGVFDNINYEKMSNFRRARSELETIKHSDKYCKPTLLVPPSHPVSMEIINSKNYNKNNNETTALDSSRFNKNSNSKLNQFDSILDYGFCIKPTGNSITSKDSLDENVTNFNLEKIEESQEKSTTGCSSTYIRAFDSSEDGDESEISLCINETSRIKTHSSRKLSKQPLRKLRYAANRKRSAKSTSSRASHCDWAHKSTHDGEQRIRPKTNNIVLLSTSDEDEDSDVEVNAISTVRNVNDRYVSDHSDSSSFIPSSSSSISSLEKRHEKDAKHESVETSLLNAPSTSTGIFRSSRKQGRNKDSNQSNRYNLIERIKMIDEMYYKPERSFPMTSGNFPHLMHNYYGQTMSQHIKSDLTNLQGLKDYLNKPIVESEFSKYFANQQTNIRLRSNSLLNASTSKSSLVPASSNLIAEILSSPGTHLAASHEDTTVGAIHVFQDERGNWFSYTFDENSTGLAKGLCPPNLFSKLSNDSEKFKSSALVPSSSIFYLNNCLPPLDPNTTDSNTTNMNNMLANLDIIGDQNKEPIKLDNIPTYGHSSQTQDSLNSTQRNRFFDSIPIIDSISDSARGYILDFSTASDFLNSINNRSLSQSYQRSQQQLKQSQYYEVNIFKLKTFKIHFDRLSLLAFLDRNLTTSELILSIILAVLVAIFSSILLHKNFFHDISLFLFCLVVASSQYTLLKSVQPDAASPTHGFNRIAIYSRPVYFCLNSLIVLLSNEYVTNYHFHKISFQLYGFDIFNQDVISVVFDVSKIFLLSFPILFTFGFLPQINTFSMYIFEQIDIHIFGGTASTMGMISATYSLVRSVLVVSLLFLLANLLNIKDTQKASFSVFCGLLMAITYHLSRLPSDPSLYWNLICSIVLQFKCFFKRLFSSTKSNVSQATTPTSTKSENHEILSDPLPQKLKKITSSRFESDFISCIFITISVFSVHVSSIFKLQPFVNNYISILAIYWGFFLHYIIRQCRKQLPWLCFASPVLKSNEYNFFEVRGPAENMWFEKMQAWLWLLEKDVIFPLFFLSYITSDCPLFIKNYGPMFGIFLLVLCSFKCIRSTFNDPSNNYIIVIFTHLFFSYDFKQINDNRDNIFLLNYFFVSIIFYKINDFLLKLRFVITYVAPWQITWGSAFHAFAQPFSVPHSAMLLVQIFISSLLSSPLQPILGSAIFFSSYVRPIKFWERDYNTKRVDHSNTRLASQIDKTQIGSDDNNLNSIFYEHLTRSLQHSLYGDLILGRWGDVSQGDCFVLASDNLNCLVHIIEFGNGLVTFQVRGLEFRGTYCQQREVEAISENVSDDEGCCCCEPGHIRGVLSVNAAFNQRWLSWEVTHANYVLEGYSISENSASTILQPYDLRKALITYYVKSVIYYCITYKDFFKWIENEELKESLSYLNETNFVDLDPTFNFNIDEDFDIMASGITRSSFKLIYLEWILYCLEQGIDPSKMECARKHEDFIISLCLGLSLLARRALGTASHHSSASMSVDFFLYGFHALFKGDFRVHCSRDEWVFQDMDFLNKVIAPSVRMSLKLHQDQFTSYEEYENPKFLFNAICEYQQSIVISHEADPIWRNAILSNVPSLLALRHVFDDGTDQYKVIILNKKFLTFRVIKINRECVRGLWAGQQQELIFLRNRNPERGSIQNAKQVLRNIINSSCDQPIGYPIYVSPLTTSFAETSEPLNKIIGPPLSLSMFKRAICGFFQKIGNRCNEVCSSSGANDLTFVNARLSKSESSDRGIDDNICGKGTLLSSQSQISTYYCRNLKKRTISDKNEEEISLHNSTLVNLSTNKNVITLLANTINAQETNVVTTGQGNITKPTSTETSFINIEQPRAVIVEKSIPNTKGDAV